MRRFQGFNAAFLLRTMYKYSVNNFNDLIFFMRDSTRRAGSHRKRRIKLWQILLRHFAKVAVKFSVGQITISITCLQNVLVNLMEQPKCW